MSLSNYVEDKLLNWFKGSAFGTAPSTVYIGLWNGDPTDAGSGGTEVTTTIRIAGRVACTFGSTSTNSGANTMANSADVDFGAAAGGANLTHFALCDASSAGNVLASAAITGQPITVVLGNLVKFATGDLVVSID